MHMHMQPFSLLSSVCVVFRTHAGTTGRAYIAAPGTPEAMISVYEDGIEPLCEVQNYCRRWSWGGGKRAAR
jgi:hypothetical protein